MSSSAAALKANHRVTRVAERAATLLDTRAAWWSVLAGTCGVLLAPLFVVDVPPLCDYPNHLARMYVLAFGTRDPFLSQMYSQHWTIIPNLAIDLVLPPLIRLLPIHVAGRILLAVTLFLPLFGAIAYHRTVFRVRSYWPIAGALICYNALFILGFMNFLLGLGMAFLIAAAWLRWRAYYPLLLALAGGAATLALFFVHLFGLLFLLVLIGAEELAWSWRHRSDRRLLFVRLPRHAAIAFAAFLPPLVLCALAPLTHVDTQMRWIPWPNRALWLLEPFMAYDGVIDWLTGSVFLVVLYLAGRHGRLRVAPGLTIALVALFIASMLSPFAMKGTAFLNARFPIVLGWLLFAGLRPTPRSPQARLAIAAVVAMTFLGRTASLAEVWFDHNRDLTDFRRVIAEVAPGSRVLIVSVFPEDAPEYWADAPRGRRIPGFFTLEFHLPGLLTIERQSFWPYLFSVTSQQPITVRPPFDRLSVAIGQPPDWQSLSARNQEHALALSPYLRDWQHNYDYVLLLNAGGAGDLMRYLPDRLTLLAAADVAALFHIRPAGGDAAARYNSGAGGIRVAAPRREAIH